MMSKWGYYLSTVFQIIIVQHLFISYKTISNRSRSLCTSSTVSQWVSMPIYSKVSQPMRFMSGKSQIGQLEILYQRMRKCEKILLNS